MESYSQKRKVNTKDDEEMRRLNSVRNEMAAIICAYSKLKDAYNALRLREQSDVERYKVISKMDKEFEILDLVIEREEQIVTRSRLSFGLAGFLSGLFIGVLGLGLCLSLLNIL